MALRAAAVAHETMIALTSPEAPLWGEAWGLVEDEGWRRVAEAEGWAACVPGEGGFWGEAVDELQRQGFELDTVLRRVTREGAEVSRAPQGVFADARDAWAAAQPAGARALDCAADEGAAPRDFGLVAAALCTDYDVVFGLEDDKVRLGAALLAGAPDPCGRAGQGTGGGGDAPGMRAFRRNRRAYRRPGATHDAMNNAAVRSFKGGDGVDVRGPKEGGVGGGRVLDDARFARDRRAIQWDIKTKDMWCPTTLDAGWTLRDLDEKETAAMQQNYPRATGPVHVVTISLDGGVAEGAVQCLDDVEAMYEAAGLRGQVPGVKAAMGAALLRAQTAQWAAAVGGGASLALAAGAAAAARRVAGAVPPQAS